MEEALIDVGPEFLDAEGQGIDGDVEPPLGAGVGEAALGRGVISVGEASGQAGAEDFGEVEGGISSIGTGDDDAAESITGAFEEASVAEGVEAGVLMRGGWDDELNKEIFLGLIGGSVPEIASVADAAGAELGRGVAQVADVGDGDGHGERGVVEGILAGGDELFLDGLRRQMVSGGDGAKVGNDAEDAAGLLGLPIGRLSG